MSPQNSATTTTSRKPADTNRLNAAKLSPPAVATMTSPGVPLPAEAGPLSSNAATRIQGSDEQHREGHDGPPAAELADELDPERQGPVRPVTGCFW